MSIGKFNSDRISRQTTIMLSVTLGITAGLLIYSAICPPPGHIDESIFKLVPWAFGFCTLFVAREAIKEGLGIKYTHGDTEIHVNKEKEEDGDEGRD